MSVITATLIPTSSPAEIPEKTVLAGLALTSFAALLLELALTRLRAEQAIYTVNSFQFTRSTRLILAYPTNGRR